MIQHVLLGAARAPVQKRSETIENSELLETASIVSISFSALL